MLPSSTMIETLVLDTSILATIGIYTISVVPIFLESPIMSTIVSIPSKKEISVRIVETKPQLSTKFLGQGKEKEEIDLDEEIAIPNWDISKLNLDQMQTFGELLQKKAKQQRLREERDK